MAWVNGPLTVFHGTDNLSATSIRLHGINPGRFRRQTDFGIGFYVTTVQHQAEQWANQRCRRTPGTANAEVLEYSLSRAQIEALVHLCFTLDDGDFYEFVAYCRSGLGNHGPTRMRPYDLVYGPVSLWPQLLAVADCDQILFSDPSKITGFSLPIRTLRPKSGSKFF